MLQPSGDINHFIMLKVHYFDAAQWFMTKKSSSGVFE